VIVSIDSGGPEPAQLYAFAFSPDFSILTLPPGAFNPPPKVHSIVLRFETAPRFQELGVPEKEFIDFLKLSFGQKRKTLVNNLKASYSGSQLTTGMKAAGLKSDVRAEAITLAQAARLFSALKEQTVPVSA